MSFPLRVNPLSPRLTLRERQVLQLVAAGYSNKEIATALGISTNAIRNHVWLICGRLKAANRTAAAVIAIQTGLLPPIATFAPFYRDDCEDSA